MKLFLIHTTTLPPAIILFLPVSTLLCILFQLSVHLARAATANSARARHARHSARTSVVAGSSRKSSGGARRRSTAPADPGRPSPLLHGSLSALPRSLSPACYHSFTPCPILISVTALLGLLCLLHSLPRPGNSYLLLRTRDLVARPWQICGFPLS